jgi:hypothetical protein
VIYTAASARCCSVGNMYARQHTIALLSGLTTKQERAYEASQKYKEGKFILERNLMVDVQ